MTVWGTLICNTSCWVYIWGIYAIKLPTVFAMSYQLNMDRGGYRGTYAICIYMAMPLQLDRLWVLRTGKMGRGEFGGLCRNIAEDELDSH